MKNIITRSRCLLLLVFCVTLMSAPVAEAQFEDAAKWVPESANCIVMVRARKILDSAIGKKEKWESDRSKAFRSGASFFPTSTERLLIASQIDYEFLESVFHVGVFEKKGPAINLVDVSKRIKGNIETIADRNALELPNNSYLVQIDNSTLVSLTPANRQMATRWLRKKTSGTMNISPYLTQAVKFADSNADVIVAFDLDGVLNPEEIAKRLTESGAVDASVAEVHAKTLTTIQGITLGVTVRDKISGAIKVDFSESPADLSAVAAKIMVHALKKNGLMIDDFENWTMSTSANQIRFVGPLSSEGLRQIGSLIHQPIANDFVSDGTGSSAEDPDVNTLTRTKQYYGDVQHVLDMIRRKDLEQLNSYSKWFSRYARDIDGISVLGVDPVMTAYGSYVANAFRDISGGLNTDQLARNKSVAAQGFSGPGGGRFNYGYGYGTLNGRNYTRDARRSAGALGTEKGANNAKDVMREIDSETAKVKDAMSEKYKINF